MMAHPLSTPLDAAEMFTARGWVVFPCDHPDAGTHCTGTARACRERRCKAERDPLQRGKHPRVKWGEIVAPVDSVALRRWFGSAGSNGATIPTNVAIACGPSGLLIVDEDEPGAFAAFCAHIGAPVPDTFTVSTGRGQHFYFTVPVDPSTGDRVPVGNAPGALAGWHCDVRGGASGSADHGGYVITAGSTHASGIVYTAADPYREAVVAPEWLISAVLTPGPPATAEGVSPRTGTGSGEAAGTLRASDGARWDDAPRYGSGDDLLGQFARHCDEVCHEGGAFRHELFLAARDGWRCVALGLLDEPSMLRALDACVWRVWAAEPDDRDHVIVFAEAQPAAAGSPWELTGSTRVLGPHPGGSGIDPSRTFLRTGEAAAAAAADGSSSAPAVTSEDDPAGCTTDGNSSVADVTDGERASEIIPPCPGGVDPAAWRTAYRKQTADEAVREYRAAQGRPSLLYITPKGRKDRPRANYLVPKMLYRDGLAVIFGASKTGKTYFVLDIGLALAAGKSWRGQRITRADGSRGMTHYVMAEGEDSNNLRIDAWLYHHGLTDDDIEGYFAYIPVPVMLTEAGIREYLPHVEADKPDLIILDTRNLMFAGRESAGEDYGVMLRALHKLQAAAGGCAIILIDHVGLANPDRPRGNGAEEAGMDTAVKVTNDHGLRTAEVTKDRSAELGTRWHYRLHQIDEVARGPFVDAPAVCVEAALDSGPLRPRIGWPMYRVSDDLDAIIRKVPNAKGKEAAADVVRLLVGLGIDEEGQLTTTIIGMIEKECERKYAKSTVRGAVTALRRAGVIEPINAGSTSPRYVIAEQWRAHVTEE